jgi:hypothetical protein
MNWLGKKAEELSPEELEAMDPVLKQALGEFRASVQAWSEAELARPRAVHAAEHKVGRVALGWGMAGVLLAGGLSAGVMVAHRHPQTEAGAPVQVVVHPQAQAAAAGPVTEPGAVQGQEKKPETAAVKTMARAEQDEPLLASVDSAVSRTVPSAMEPLVALANESGAGK